MTTLGVAGCQAHNEKTMKTLFFGLLCVFLLPVTTAYASEQRIYSSPNGKYHAIVIPLRQAGYVAGESEIVIKTEKGKILTSKSYGSKDGKKGFGVEKAHWTPDSNFFVYSMSSSGGHQPWHSPVYFFSVHDFKIRSLDDHVGAVTDPNFELSAPNTVRGVATKGNIDAETPFEVGLGELLRRERPK